MKTFWQSIFLLGFISSLSYAQEIENFQFTDLEGKKYDLYQMLEKGKYLLVAMTFNS